VEARQKKLPTIFAPSDEFYSHSQDRKSWITFPQKTHFSEEAQNRYLTQGNTHRFCGRGKKYRFLTNEMTLPPGIIAFLYKLRWDIEKMFDQSKNKFHEKKAWAKSKNSKKQQAHFITIAHNLCILLERILQDEEGIVDQKSI